MHLPLYTARYIRKQLVLSAKKPANGVEKHYYSVAPPFSHLEYRGLSEPAKTLRQALNGDAEAEEWLVNYLGQLIYTHCVQQKWKIGSVGKAVGAARVVLAPKIHGIALTDEAAGELMLINRSSFQKSWQKRLGYFEPWVRAWIVELKGV